MSATARAIGHIRTLNAPAAAPPTLLDAAKVVVALSGWDSGKEVFHTSAMAIEVLKAAIRREENPTFTLAPEPLPSGL